MKIKYLTIIFGLLILMLSIGIVSATQDNNDTLSLEETPVDDSVSVNQKDLGKIKEAETNNTNINPSTTTTNTTKTVKKTTVSTPETNFLYKRNSVFKIKIKDKQTNKSVKNLKIAFKIKSGKKIKTYTLKTDNKGIATFKTKKLSLGYHKFTITSKNSKYKVKKKDYIFIGNLYIDNVEMGKTKKLRNGDVLQTFIQKKNGKYKKGVHVSTSYTGGKNPTKTSPEGKYTKIIKAKFYFKNKKTGEVIIIKSKGNLINIGGELYRDLPNANLMKNYTPIKTKIYYLISKLE